MGGASSIQIDMSHHQTTYIQSNHKHNCCHTCNDIHPCDTDDTKGVDDEWWRLIDAVCVSRNIICINDTVRETIESDIRLLATENVDINYVVTFVTKLSTNIREILNIDIPNAPNTQCTPEDELHVLQYLCEHDKLKLTSSGYVMINDCKYLVGRYKDQKRKVFYDACPFHGFSEGSKKNKNYFETKGWIFVDLSMLKIKSHIKLTDMTIHQIIKHKFFGGKKSIDRVNPRNFSLFFKINETM